jgi:hypothetical protein
LHGRAAADRCRLPPGRLQHRASRRRDPSVDLNEADAQTLAALPGLGPADAERIVAHRRYAAKEDLVQRKVLDEPHYAAIADHVFVGPPAVPDYLRAVAPVPEVH